MQKGDRRVPLARCRGVSLKNGRRPSGFDFKSWTRATSQIRPALNPLAPDQASCSGVRLRVAAALLADADRIADERDAEATHYGFIHTLPAAQNSRRCLRRIRFAGCHDFRVGNRRERHISRIFDRGRRRIRHRYIWQLCRRHVSRWIARLGAGRLSITVAFLI